MDSWLPLLTGLVGTTLGGAIAYFNVSIQWKRQRATERDRFLLGKLEEVCKVVIEIEFRLRGVSSETILRLNKAEQTKSTEETAAPIPLEQMRMLVSMYFESLIPYTQAVVEARDRLGDHLGDSIMSRPNNRAEYEARQTEAHQAFNYAKTRCESFLAEAARITKGLM